MCSIVLRRINAWIILRGFIKYDEEYRSLFPLALWRRLKFLADIIFRLFLINNMSEDDIFFIITIRNAGVR